MRVISHSKGTRGRRVPQGRWEEHKVVVEDDQGRQHEIVFEGVFTKKQARVRLEAEVAKLRGIPS